MIIRLRESKGMVRISGDAFGLPCVQQVLLHGVPEFDCAGGHSHGAYEILCVPKGNLQIKFRGRSSIEVQRNHFIIIPPRVVHYEVPDLQSLATIHSVLFDPGCPDGWQNTPFSKQDLQRFNEHCEKSKFQVRPLTAFLRRSLSHMTREALSSSVGPKHFAFKCALRSWVCLVILYAIRKTNEEVKTSTK